MYDKEGSTALLCAAYRGQLSAQTALLKRGASINEHNFNCRTALMLAAANGHDGCVRGLIAAGADTCCVDKRGKTALDLAVEVEMEARSFSDDANDDNLGISRITEVVALLRPATFFAKCFQIVCCLFGVPSSSSASSLSVRHQQKQITEEKEIQLE